MSLVFLFGPSDWIRTSGRPRLRRAARAAGLKYKRPLVRRPFEINIGIVPFGLSRYLVRVFITDLTNIHRQWAHIPFSNAKILFSHIRQARFLLLQWSRKEVKALKRDKRYLFLDDFEHRLAIVGMNHFRNYLVQTGKPTEDVDALLLKLIKAKRKRISQKRTS